MRPSQERPQTIFGGKRIVPWFLSAEISGSWQCAFLKHSAPFLAPATRLSALLPGNSLRTAQPPRIRPKPSLQPACPPSHFLLRPWLWILPSGSAAPAAIFLCWPHQSPRHGRNRSSAARQLPGGLPPMALELFPPRGMTTAANRRMMIAEDHSISQEATP